MLFDGILLISILLFIVILIICYNKLQNKKEQFENYFHVTKPIGNQKYSYTPEQIIFSNKDSNFSNKDKFFGDLDYSGLLEIDENSKLYIGNSVRKETSIDSTFLKSIKEKQYPYIEETSDGDRLRFNNTREYIDANNLRALKGHKLVPIYNDKHENAHALKIVADTAAFENPGFRCGYVSTAQSKRGKITGIIPYGNEY